MNEPMHPIEKGIKTAIISSRVRSLEGASLFSSSTVEAISHNDSDAGNNRVQHSSQIEFVGEVTPRVDSTDAENIVNNAPMPCSFFRTCTRRTMFSIAKPTAVGMIIADVEATCSRGMFLAAYLC